MSRQLTKSLVDESGKGLWITVASELLQSFILFASEVEIDDIGQGKREVDRANHDSQDSVRKFVSRVTKFIKPLDDLVVLITTLGPVEQGRNSADETSDSELKEM